MLANQDVLSPDSSVPSSAKGKRVKAATKSKARRSVAGLTVIAFLWPHLLHADSKTKADSLAYCLGVAEFDENFKLLNVAYLKKMSHPAKQILRFQHLAENDRARVERLRSELRRLGALTVSGLRADELSHNTAGFQSSRECMVHQFSTCVQRCYRAGKGGNGRDEPANCEEACGLPQACKAATSCNEFDVNS